MHKAVFLLLVILMGLLPAGVAGAQPSQPPAQPPEGLYLAPNACWCVAGDDRRYGLEIGQWDSNVDMFADALGITPTVIGTEMAMRFGLGFSQIADKRLVSGHIDVGVGGPRAYFLAGPSLWVGEVATRVGGRASVGVHLGRKLSLAAVGLWTYRFHSDVGAELIITL